MGRDKGQNTEPKKALKTYTRASSSRAPQSQEWAGPRTSTRTAQRFSRDLMDRTNETEEEERARWEAEIDREIEEALNDDSEREEEPAEEQRGPKRQETTPTYTKLLAHLKAGDKWFPMRFPDPQALRELGISDDVETLLKNMGMESLFGMAYPVHKEVSCQFLASFNLVHHYEEDDDEGFGYIEFKVKGKQYRVGFTRLSSIFGFNDGKDSVLPSSVLISTDVWAAIAGEVRVPGEDKCNDILNPAVRYAHKVLSHTFYSRREPGGVNEDELKHLAMAIWPLVDEDDLKNTKREDFSNLGLIGVLMRRFDYYKHWAWTTYNQKPKLFIGSLITPILQALKIDLGPIHAEPAFLDLPYLKRTDFLAGRLGDRFVYDFYSGYFPAIHSYFLLPNEALTSLREPLNMRFNPEPHHLVPEDHPEFEPISISKKRKSRASTSRAPRHSDADDESTPARVYGTGRYHFEPYRSTSTSVALRRALSQNEKLLRWNKLQDSTIYKLKNSVKVLKRQMKKVTSLLSQVSIGSGCQRDDAMAGSSTLPRPSYYDPPRSPNTQLQRSRRNTAPPQRQSSNESPSVATADEYDTEGASFT